VERPGRVVRFARLIHRPVRVLGGPAVRAAYGGNLKPALVTTPGGTGMGEAARILASRGRSALTQGLLAVCDHTRPTPQNPY
jgi:hypothetical protein